MNHILNGQGGLGAGVVLYPVQFPLVVRLGGQVRLLSLPGYLILWVLPV